MADAAPTIDGITKTPGQKDAGVPDDRGKLLVKRVKFALLLFVGGPYLAYLGWLLFLLASLPDPSGGMDALLLVGRSTAMIGLLLLFLALAGFRILRATKLPLQQRILAAARALLIMSPGLILSGVVPGSIAQEPRMWVEIVSPADGGDFVAPLPIDFSLENAIGVLLRRNLRPMEYRWDYDGDGQVNEVTTLPNASAFYDRAGVYTLRVEVMLEDGSSRTVSYRIRVPYAVFSYSPKHPIVDEPVTFSIRHLVDDPGQIKQAEWDFDANGEPDKVNQGADVDYLFRQTGAHPISVVVQLQNKSRRTFEKEIDVSEPPPLPFPISLTSESEHLISPAPFGTVFEVATEESLKEVVWNFGDGTEEMKGVRVGHTFKTNGVYMVEAKARSVRGVIATVRVKVRIVEMLNLPDLRFEGTPAVAGNKIVGELPVRIELTPKTSLPLVDFFWEAPNATVVEETPPEQIKATFRREGIYTITLIAQDSSGQAKRIPITVEVKPVSSVIAIRMVPEGGVAPLDVRFDASETVIPGKEISGFEWVFGDDAQGAPRQAGSQVHYTFDNPGTYAVHLNVFTTTGEKFSESKTIVVRPPALNACFTASRTSGSLGEKGVVGVRFESCSTGNPTGVLWDFGDGSQGDDKSPVVVHTYEKTGKFKVTLSLKNAIGTQSFAEPLTITITP